MWGDVPDRSRSTAARHPNPTLSLTLLHSPGRSRSTCPAAPGGDGGGDDECERRSVGRGMLGGRWEGGGRDGRGWQRRQRLCRYRVRLRRERSGALAAVGELRLDEGEEVGLHLRRDGLLVQVQPVHELGHPLHAPGERVDGRAVLARKYKCGSSITCLVVHYTCASSVHPRCRNFTPNLSRGRPKDPPPARPPCQPADQAAT